MDTANMIAAIAAGETVTTKKKGTCKGQKVELTVTTTAPAALPVTVVDETVQDEPETYTKLPVDAGKRTVEVLPGLTLVMYSRGYCCLRLKGKAWGGQKVTIGRPLYRADIKALVEALFAECGNTKTYEEANGTEAVPF